MIKKTQDTYSKFKMFLHFKFLLQFKLLLLLLLPVITVVAYHHHPISRISPISPISLTSFLQSRGGYQADSDPNPNPPSAELEQADIDDGDDGDDDDPNPNPTPTPGVLVLIDGFSAYLSGLAKDYCNDHNIHIIEAVSPYVASIFELQGKPLPDKFQAPKPGEEVAWGEGNDLFLFLEQGIPLAAIAESDSGVSTAERIIHAFPGVKGNGISPQLRNKHTMNALAAGQGLKVVRQELVSEWDVAEKFIIKLLSSSQKVILKPVRGVASDGVHLCRTLQEAQRSFRTLLNSSQFEGGINTAVLIQEFAEGQEYAVDTVTRDGDIKVVALWKYHKFQAPNGAPFVYQATELISSRGDVEEAVCDYACRALGACGMKWGPAHTEVKHAQTSGCQLIEINARWHAMNFAQITRPCLGHDAVVSALDVFFRPRAFLQLPDRPTELQKAGCMVHLVSYVEGRVSAIRHVEEMRELASVLILEVGVEVGDRVAQTKDIRTDIGYLVLVHEDREQAHP